MPKIRLNYQNLKLLKAENGSTMEHRITRKLLFISLVILSSCNYNNVEELYPNPLNNCDTINVTFSGTIFPLITDNCFDCHSGSSPQGILLFEDYDAISAAGKIPAGQYGSLYGAISHYPTNKPMPFNRPQLSDCNILKVKKWIDAETPDN